MCIKLALIGVFVWLTNFGFLERVELLVNQQRMVTLLAYVLIWAVAIVALLVIAFHPRARTRLLWAIPVALSSAAAYGYYQIAHSDLSVFDMLYLWSARDEANRAGAFYAPAIVKAVLIMIFGLLTLAMPPAVFSVPMRKWLRRMVLLPLVPILTIMGIVYAKAGGGSQALPKQFTPLALSALVAQKVATQGTPVRREVAWTAAPGRRVRHIVMLVDESVRADYLDLSPGNPHTPVLASLAEKFVDYGTATSGGNCSSYSNAIFRFAASRGDLIGSANTNPTLWQFAKKAGYRTVYIDAQAMANANPGTFQNFMTVSETSHIDRYAAILEGGPEHADMRLAEILAEELARPEPVFIYANKNGAHFPYDHSYPREVAIYRPVMSDGGDTVETRIASYRNAIAWSVDKFMGALFAKANFADTALIYTADHGQSLEPRGLTHCTVEDPAPRTAAVPLLVYAADPALRQRFEAGAARSRGKASHFQIAPSLLSLMGYTDADIATAYDETLFAAPAREPAFTSGDIFGLFASEVRWTRVDPKALKIEAEALRILPEAKTQ
jgi:lipid A ethanolaminephosphotransferase